MQSVSLSAPENGFHLPHFHQPKFNPEKRFQFCAFNPSNADPSSSASAWERLKQYCLKKNELERKLESLSSPDFIFNENQANSIALIKEAIESPDFPRIKSLIINFFKNLNYQEINIIFQEIGKGTPFPENIANLVSLFPIEELENFLKDSFPNYANFEELKLYYTEVEILDPQNIRKPKPYLISLLTHLIETLLTAFNYFKAGAHTEGSFHASHLLMLYRDLFITLPLNLFVIIQLCLSHAVSSILLTGALLSALFSLALFYIKWMKPTPEDVSYCQNYTLEAQKGKFDPVVGRESELNLMIETLEKGKRKVKQHPLLVGPTGVGKTELFKALAQKIIQDNHQFLKNKTFHVVDMPGITKINHVVGDKIKFLMDQIANHEKDIILGLEEFSALFASDEFGQSLHGLLDKIPYVIGAMTEDDYKKYIIPNMTLERRFVVIQINSMTEVNSVKVMRQYLNEENIFIPDELLKTIFKVSSEENKKLLQPAASLVLLSDVIDELEKNSFNEISAFHLGNFYLRVQYHKRCCERLLQKIEKVKVASEPALQELRKQFLFLKYFIEPNYTLSKNAEEELQKLIKDKATKLSNISLSLKR